MIFTRTSPRKTMSLGDTLLQLLFRFIFSTVHGAYLPHSYIGYYYYYYCDWVDTRRQGSLFTYYIIYARTMTVYDLRVRVGRATFEACSGNLEVSGTIPAFDLGPRETKKNLCRGGRSEDLLILLTKSLQNSVFNWVTDRRIHHSSVRQTLTLTTPTVDSSSPTSDG